MTSYILIVEDDEHDISFTNRALKLCSVQNDVRIARDGEEALDVLARDEKPCLILLDLKMPKVDGFTVLKQIRVTPSLQQVPVIIVSGSVLEADRVRAMILGATNYVVKKIDLRDFSELLCLALSPYASILDMKGRTGPD